MDVFDAGAALCAPFLAELPVAGLSISVVSGGGAQSTVSTSDLIAARLEELQFQLGEGPTRDVLRRARPVLAADLRDESAMRDWPVFSPAAVDVGARALFSFPLLIGTVAVGVVSLYALVVRPSWSDGVLRTATGLVEATVQPAIELATRSAVEESRPGARHQTEMRREVHQAAGMLMVQLDCSIDDAMSRLRAHAYAAEQPIEVAAKDVISGALRLAAVDD